MDQMLLGPIQTLLLRFLKPWMEDQLKYLLSYEDNFENLKGGVDELKKEKEELRHRVEDEENRYGKEIEGYVRNWLEEANKIYQNCDEFLSKEGHANAGCTNGILPNPVTRYNLSKEADVRRKDVSKQVQRLQRLKKNHDSISYWGFPPSMSVALFNVDYVSLESRSETMKNIRKAMEDSSVRMIGVHGLSGVGKTTLVIEAIKKAQEEDKLFKWVILANVTRNPDVRKLQGQIADGLGMKLEEETVTGRAARIQKRLKKEKENTLIILDELWAKLDFNMLGIPSENIDDGSQKNIKEGKSPGAQNMGNTKIDNTGCNKTGTEKLPGASNEKKTKETLSRYKVLLISVSKQVLSIQMDGKRNEIFPVEGLKDKEAEKLFIEMAGKGHGNSELGELASQIAKKCNGMPMAIVTTAKALKHESPMVWEDANRQLGRQKLTGGPEYSIKLSYDLLENEELKFTFLLCARMGQDALVVDLVKYSIGLGFLQGVYTVREARDRVDVLLIKLKESSLLSDSYSSDRFTMQDSVRGAAFSIATKDEHVFMMTKGRLDEWPDEHRLRRCTAISLRHCDIIEQFPKSIKCPKLRVFHIDSNDASLKIPKDFFKGMKELRVLVLTGIDLSSLPSSITCLAKLRMLCLERCKLGELLSSIGKLRNLRILSLSGSDIEGLPAELGKLAKLQILDISNCSKLGEIPSNVISNLTSLEELYMRNSLIQWKVEGQENQSNIASLSELRHLNQLTTLDIHITNVAHLPNNLFFDKLKSYKIVIGDWNAYLERDFKMPEKYEAPRFLALQLKDGFDIHSQKGIKMLFERVENLLLGELELKGVRDIFYELNLKGFPYLTHLSIVSNSDIKSIINSNERQHPEKAFPKLESLCLYKLKNMQQICYSKLTGDSFSKLKIIKIKLCGQLKNVFFFSLVQYLTALEIIEVSECNSLKEIVVAEHITDKIEFRELRSLALQSLSKFIGFFTIHPSTEERVPLFDEKVVVPKLERMELSSIKIQNIWSNQTLPNSYFQNLIHLDVNDCGNLQYLLSLSMAKRLVNLQSLFVSECEAMEKIFNKDEVSKKDSNDDGIFTKLKNVKLTSIKSLKTIWPFQVPSKSFGKLDNLIIEKCDKLENVFPSDLVGKFQSLCNLSVTYCKSMKEIFQLEGDPKRDADGETNLQNVHLEALPKLKDVWNKNPKGILNFKNLQNIWVSECPSLKSIFPVSVAQDLKKLEYLVVRDCGRLKEIVAKGNDEGTNMSTGIPFVFPALTTMKLLELPKLKSFYPGKHELTWPELNNMSVELCDKLEPFRTESADPQRKPLLPEEVIIYKLKSMQIEPRNAKLLRSYIGNYRMDNLEELHLSRLVNTEILFAFLHTNPNLKSLWLNFCFFHELVPPRGPPAFENLGVVPTLKSLMLIDLPLLKNIGFERDTVLQRIEFLIVRICPRLITLAPPSVSFIHLTNLEVFNCNKLMNVMAPSTAKSLVQLTTMKVIKCDSVKEIVSGLGNEEEENGGKIVFRQLKVLELVSLHKLTSFCSSMSCSFEFPSLEKLVVSACPTLEKFSANVKITPILRQIYVVHREDQRLQKWAGDVNHTIKNMLEDKTFFEGMDEVTVSDLADLKVWGSEVSRDNWFNSLKILKLENCNFQSREIASSVLPYLKNLKDLQVRDCSNVEVLFDMNDTEITGTSFLLRKLTLDGLPNLKHVWNGEGILGFQNLKKVAVTNCENLKTLFSATLAKNLKKLQKLAVNDCKELLEIVGKEEAAASAEATQEFLFPRLTSLDLLMCPKLNHFYPERFTLECPELNHLDVFSCGKLELFQSHQQDNPEGQGSSTSAYGQPLFLDHKVIFNLESLRLNSIYTSNTTMMIRHGQFQEDPLDKLNQLSLCFDDVNEVPFLPFPFLEKACKLEFLQVRLCSGLKEIFPSQKLEVVKNGLLGRLKILFLFQLLELQSIGLEYPWLNRFCEKLQQLIVVSCHRLTTLVHSTVSFSNLKILTLAECDGLKYLFTSSTAKTLVHLEEMYIWQCESMKEVIAKEQEQDETNEIEFERLDTVLLYSLPSLLCFYPGDANLKLPSLVQVAICECPKMGIFSQGSIDAESFRGVQVSSDSNDDLVFHDNLKVTAEMLFLHQAHLVLGDHRKLKEIWLGEAQVADGSFSNLKSLVVVGCEFLSNTVLPFHLLPFLSNLEELKVQKCNSVEAIFDVKDAQTNDTKTIDIPLKRLILEQLPILKHVWNEDPQGSLSLPFLEEVSVDGCESIQSLFPASVAKDKLQKLDVQNCKELVEIVARDEAATKEEIEELIMFPVVTSLRLWNLPNLKCIHPGMHNLEWPMLKELNVYHCQMLKIFATEFQTCPDSHPEGQDRFPTDQQALVSVEKVAPHLEQLTLSKEDIMMIEQGQLHVDLQAIKFMKLQCFHDVSDVFPSVFLSKLTLPSIEKLRVVHSSFEEIFPSQRPDIDYTAIVSQLKGLELNDLSMLNSIGLEHSWMGPFLENLQTLTVLKCECLKNLAPSTVSFSHLSELIVEGCDGLQYLFTSSTAKSLGLLNKICITNCGSIEEIVVKEGDEPVEDEMIFGQLKILSLNLLPKLGIFYKGSSTLNFPSLEQVSLIQCHSMKIFCNGEVVVPKILVGKIDGVYWCGDLNTAVKRQFGEGSSLS